MRKFAKRVARAPWAQPLWRLMFRASARGMNPDGAINDGALWRQNLNLCLAKLGYGVGTAVDDSGEKKLVEFIRPHLSAAPIVFDVGGNLGDYTRLVAAVLPAAAIYTFEPSLTTFQSISAALAGVKNVTLTNVGFSNEDEKATLYSNEPNSGLASVYRRDLDHLGIKMGQKEEITLTTLDGFCQRNGIESIELLKLDTEGHELKILTGAAKMLAADAIACIQFEFGGCNIDSRSYFRDFFTLLNPKYQLYRLMPTGMMRVAAYVETDEIFITTNYIALSRKRFAGNDHDVRFS